MKPLHRLPEHSADLTSIIGGLCYGIGLAAGILGAWFLPTWALAGLLAAAFAAWVITRRPL